MKQVIIRCDHCYTEFGDVEVLKSEGLPIEPGSINVCPRCGQVCKFDEDLNLKMMKGEDIQQLVHDFPDVYNGIVQTVAIIMERVKLN